MAGGQPAILHGSYAGAGDGRGVYASEIAATFFKKRFPVGNRLAADIKSKWSSLLEIARNRSATRLLWHPTSCCLRRRYRCRVFGLVDVAANERDHIGGTLDACEV